MKIGIVSKKTGIGIHAIRYYEKQGLIKRPEKDNSGHRVYLQKDIELLDWISCMKNSGLSLSKIRKYAVAFYDDDNNICLALLKEHLQNLKEQQENLVHYISVTERKVASLNKA